MGAAFERVAGLEFPEAVKGHEGCVIDVNGNEYIDACGGAGIACLGYSEKRVIEAIKRQADTLPFAHQLFFTNEPAEALANDLVSDAPINLKKVFFGCGGSEQIDGTLKLARQYFVDKGELQRRYFIGRTHSFHGNSIGALSVGSHKARRDPYLPLLSQSHQVSAGYAYREQRSNESDSDYANRLAEELDNKIQEIGPENVIAFVAETVGGATAGCLTSPPDYFKKTREICNRYGVLLILDEIMCGLGRTGQRFACLQEGVSPDMLVVAKGLGAGYQPISATLATNEIYKTVMDRRGYFQHGHSYQAHPIACAAALAVQQVIRDDNLMANVRTQGDRLQALLLEKFENHPHVGDIRGRGLFYALEIVADRDTKAPFDPSKLLWLRIRNKGLNNGLMCYPGAGCADGVNGDHVLLAPPFNTTGEQIEIMVDRLAVALDSALSGIK